MSGEISLNASLFHSNIEALKSAVSDIESKMNKSETLDKTNIDPFVKDLEQVIRALEVVQNYKNMLEEDVAGIKKVGEGLQNQDDALSRPQHDIRDGHQPIQM